MTRRGAVVVETPHPLGALLPALYQEDDLAQRFTRGLDAVLAPVLCVLDCVESYLDPDLAPGDFVAWLASCTGVDEEEGLPLAQQRAVVGAAARTYRWHGTTRGITSAVAAVSGGGVAVTDSGGATWTRDPTERPPDPGRPLVEVVVHAPAPGVTRSHLERAIEGAKPAHVAHRLTVVGDEP
ncbi:MAG TPA: phage tail protein [Actinomycetota bacterium]|nr:phage tail protein [Actinomycetota bacterium]